MSDKQRGLVLEFLDANNPRRNTYKVLDWKTKQDGTLASYARGLCRVARDQELDLTEATAYDINRLIDAYLNGNVEGVKDEGLANGSVRNLQGSTRRFYLYHGNLRVDCDCTHFADQHKPPVDEQDMFTLEEVQALRDEAKRRESQNACLVDILLYTGQRRNVVLNLRLKDAKPDKGIFYPNDDDGNLKGANRKRPLLGAERAVREWKR